GMGFYNYCLAIGIALWALGLWYRAVARRSQPLWIGFVAVVVLLVLTHPVPALFVYILVGLDVAWRMQQRWRNHRIAPSDGAHYLRGFGWDIFYMLLAWCTVVYIAHFTGGSRVVANVLQTYNRKVVLLKLAKLSTLSMFSGTQLTTVAYRISLYILLILAIVLAFRGCKARWRNRTATPSDILLGCSLLLLIVIPILPPVMNGANYFSQRLVILVWIGALAAASGYARLSPPVRLAIAGSACIYAMAVLTLANMRVRPVAAQIAEIETAPVSKQQLTGLALGLPTGPSAMDLDYVPYYWTAARYFRRSHSTLLNGGWLYESYVALGSKVGSISDQLTPYMQDSPGDVYHLLLRSKAAQAQIMPHANLVVFVGYATPNALQTTLRTIDQAEPSRNWSCQPAEWYSVCTAPFLSVAPKN
ncbi:MAG TPA: hypothetical protein VMU62_03960, partial [Acidobacteriaceae bacterium]|nr:hypothetical protein [Acidobacteriaceae bacterium]